MNPHAREHPLNGGGRQSSESDGIGWDWVTVLVVMLFVALVALFTFELWLPHGFPHY